MNDRLKTLLLFAGMLVVVVLGSWFYSRSLSGKNNRKTAPSAVGGRPSATVSSSPIRTEMNPEFDRAVELIGENRLDEAEQALEGIPQDDPSFAMALSRWAEVRHLRGDRAGAVDRLERMAELETENPELQLEVARGYFRIGHYESAELATLRTLELIPGHLRARYYVALCRVAQDRLPLAIDAYHRAFALDAQATYAAEARTELQRLHEMPDSPPSVHYALAFFAGTLGQQDRELDELEHFLTLQETGPAAENARARVNEARGKR